MVTPRTLARGESIIIRGVRVKLLNTQGARGTLGIEVAEGVNRKDVLEIDLDTEEKDLTYKRLDR